MEQELNLYDKLVNINQTLKVTIDQVNELREYIGVKGAESVNQLGEWLMKNCPEESFNYGKAPCGEGAVKMAIRLLETAKEQHLLQMTS